MQHLSFSFESFIVGRRGEAAEVGQCCRHSANSGRFERRCGVEGGSSDDVGEVCGVVAVLVGQFDFVAPERRRCAVAGREDDDVSSRDTGGFSDRLSDEPFEPIGDAVRVEGNNRGGFAV